MNNAACVEAPGNTPPYTCSCASGFTGQYCENEVDIEQQGSSNLVSDSGEESSSSFPVAIVAIVFVAVILLLVAFVVARRRRRRSALTMFAEVTSGNYGAIPSGGSSAYGLGG